MQNFSDQKKKKAKFRKRRRRRKCIVRCPSIWRQRDYLAPLAKALVTSCTVRWGLPCTKASNLGEDTTCSMFLTRKPKVVSFKLSLQQVSAISRVSRALEVLSELSKCRSQCLSKCGIAYLSAARDKAQTCFSNVSSGKAPLQRNSSRDSSSSWFKSGIVMVLLGAALHSSHSSMFLKISDLVAYNMIIYK